ncbi:MAG: hypothetical protein ACTIL1_12385 [Staphylococcus equorum]
MISKLDNLSTTKVKKKRKARSRRLIQKGALFEKYFEAENLSIDESEQLLKIFANYVNKNKPDKNKKDSPNL